MALGIGAALLGSAGIQAGSALLGSFLNNKNDDSRAKEERDYARQKEFAQNQIQWRAADAEKAGISKFAALGGNGTFYTPSYSSGSSSSFGDTVSNVGNIAGSALSQYAIASQQEAIAGQQLDNESKRLDILEKMQKLNVDGKGQGNSTQNIVGAAGNLKLPGKELMEQYEDSVIGVPFKLAGLEDALTKDRFGAYKDFKQMFGSLSKGIETAHESRGWHGSIRSVPVFDLSKYSNKELDTLADVLINKTPLLNKAINSGWSVKDVKSWITGRKTKYLNNVLQGYDPVGSDTYSVFGKTIYSKRRSL